MGDIAKTFISWTLKISYWGMMVMTMMFIVTSAVTIIMTPLNTGVISDVLAMIQIWLPFNMGIIVGWMTVAIGAYISMKLAAMIYDFIDSFIG